MTTKCCSTYCATLSPQLPDRKNIGGIVENRFNATSHGIRFDVPELFIQNMAYAAGGAQASKPYTPWIIYAIEQLTKKKNCPHVPKAFTPPVRDIYEL